MRGTDENNSIQLGMVEAIVSWCNCLQGQIRVGEALRLVSASIDAETAILSRVSRQYNGRTRIITQDRDSDRDEIVVDRSFARAVLQEYMGKAQLGTIWLSRLAHEEMDADLRHFQMRAKLGETVVIPIGTGAKTIDFIEFHFRTAPNRSQHAALNVLASNLTKTWTNRKPGLFASSMPHARSKLALQPEESAPILSDKNPARLSRMEYRVCVLLNRGHSPCELREELGISEATLRTHLRNVYSKTGAENLPRLLYQLVSSEPYPIAVGA